ncbi:leucine-rich repeat extensin-like protein 5 [Helianthus annuus]|uniref:leucine-rich repeat extensin-like protein 5 n=1 Tax=Helianthus annuus TaxID=4232 RepID=UPI000B8F429D|nr:leucine-rich repeat extensin-like protein 5 [Helianthus annuus]
MPPRFRRGRGKAPVTGHDHEAGPSHRRTPSITMSTSPQEPWRTYIEPGRRSVSLSSSPSYHHSFGPQSENKPNNPQPSFIPLQRSNSHHSFGDPTPAFQSRFNSANYIQEPVGFNPLGPEDHFSSDHVMDMDEDTDPVEPATGTPNHPIEISDGSSFHGSPYRGSDSYQARFNQIEWYFTPSGHSSPYHQQQQQNPSVDSHFVAVTPPPSPPVQQPPLEPPRPRRSNAWMSVRGEVDPYQAAWDYNALHPEGPYGGPWTTGYPPYVYQHPSPPQPLYQQPPQPQLILPERQQEVLDRLDKCERDIQADRRNNRGFFKGLSDLIKGKSKRRDY